jgi:hypothetical protein
MRAIDTFSRLGKKLYDVGGKIAQGTAVTAAGTSTLTGIKYAQSGWDKLKDYIPSAAHEEFGRQVSYSLSVPLAVMGLADGIAGIYKVRSLGSSANFSDYASIPFRLFPVLAPLISYATHGDILTAVGGSLAVSAIGQGLKYVGNLKRKDSESYVKSKRAKMAEVISLAGAMATLATGIVYASKGWKDVIEKYTPSGLNKSVGSEISIATSIPLAVMGLADGIHALYGIKEKPRKSAIDYTAAFFRAAPVVIAPVLAVTTGNPLYTIGSSLAASIIGHSLTALSQTRDRRKSD